MVRICPKCGSLDIQENSTEGVDQFYCATCGYGECSLDTVFPDIERNKIEEFRRQL